MIVPQSQHFETSLGQTLCADGILFPHLRVLSTIHFNREHRLQAYEIDDIVPEGMLPAKLEVSHLLSPQAGPDTLLCVSRILTQTALQPWLEDSLVCLAFHAAAYPIPTPPLEGEGEREFQKFECRVQKQQRA